MSLSCLNNFVGIRPCGYSPSLSGLYVDSLPGIDLSWMDAVASDEQVTYAGLFADLQANALLTFRDDVIEEFSKRYMVKQITQSVDLGKQLTTNNPIITTPAGLQYGMLLETTYDSSLASAQSALLNIHVQNVSFYYNPTSGGNTFTITATDANTGTVLYTNTLTTAVAGWNTIWVNQEFSSQRVYLTVQTAGGSEIASFSELDLSNFYLDNFGLQPGYGWAFGGNFLNFYWGGWGCGVRVRGVTWNGNVNTAGTTGTNTFGLSAQIAGKCSFDSVVCQNMQHFASAWQHLLAIELLNYRIQSGGIRLNKWTTINREQAMAMQKMFTLKYRGGTDEATGLTYPGKLRQAIESIQLNQQDCCLKTNDYLMSMEVQM
jgi:hypothetical protein